MKYFSRNYITDCQYFDIIMKNIFKKCYFFVNKKTNPVVITMN